MPDLLRLLGQAWLEKGETEAAQRLLTEARDRAESMDAKASLWQVLFHMSRLETDPEKSARLLQEAREIIDFIAGKTGSPDFRDLFLALPDVRAVIESAG